jgi:hypothetical protein
MRRRGVQIEIAMNQPDILQDFAHVAGSGIGNHRQVFDIGYAR